MTILGRRTQVLARSGDASRTHQSMKEECDINRILGRWRRQGFTNNIALGTPVYEDFSNAQDYLTAMNAVNKARELFEAMPSRVRARVENDPSQLIAFVEDPANAEELVELGLTEPIATEPVIPDLTPPGLPKSEEDAPAPAPPGEPETVPT